MSDEQESFVEKSARIVELATIPPKVELTRKDHIERFVGWLTAAIAIAALTWAVLVGIQGSQIAACVNANLGSRSAPTVTDEQAHVAWAQAVSQVISSPDFPAPGEISKLVAATDTYATVLKADQVERNEHPLGKC